MKNIISKGIAVATLTVAATFISTGSVYAADEVRYRVAFEGLFIAQNHPHPSNNFPGDPHFSPNVLVAHSSGISLWKAGQLSSPGVELVAETGNPTVLVNALQGLVGGSVGEFKRTASRFNGNQTISQEIEVSPTHPLISSVTMVAPSPDWMAGLQSIDLRDSTDSTGWVRTLSLDVFPYDAGTDSGFDYQSADLSTNPPVVIAPLRNTSPFSNNPVGRVTIERISDPNTDNSPFPVAKPDQASTTVDTEISIDVLDNDTGNGLILQQVNDWTTEAGRASISNGEVKYKPFAGFTGQDTFWYGFVDTQGRTNSAQVTVTVSPANTGGNNGAYPVANTDTVSAIENSTARFDVLENDTGNGLSLTEVNLYSVQGGTARIINNKIDYTPPSDYTGEDSLWYVFADSIGRTNAAEIRVTISSANDGSAYPVAITDQGYTTRNTSTSIYVLGNDSGNGLRVTDSNDWTVRGGRTTFRDDSVQYTPPAGYVGDDSFWYVFTDSQGRTNAAEVKVRIF